MSYCTTANARQEAGFTNNTAILDATITRHQSAADSRIDSVIGKLYVLPLSETPGLIEQISRYLTAGYLLLEEYGTEAEGTSKDGAAKVKWAEDQLKMIENGLIILTNSSGTPIAASESVAMDGWPNDSTGTDITPQSEKNDPPRIEIGMEF